MRKALTKKIRFEVFKRDSFTCQYCGGKAPEAVLVVDHIDPASKGGSSDILNLITACQPCNAGKSDRVLSDNSVLEKRRFQLEQLQERKEQLEMMMQWQNALLSLEDTAEQEAAAFWAQIAAPFSLTEQGRTELGKLIRKYGLQEVLVSMRLAVDKYLEHEGGKPTQNSVEVAWKYVDRIGNMRRVDQEKPHIKDLLYVRGILRNRFWYCDEHRALELLEDAYDAGVSIEDLKGIARRSRNWSAWQTEIEQFIEP